MITSIIRHESSEATKPCISEEQNGSSQIPQEAALEVFREAPLKASPFRATVPLFPIKNLT